MRRLKWVVSASRVAILLRRSWPSVDCRTFILGVASIDSVEMGLCTASWVVAYIVLIIS